MKVICCSHMPFVKEAFSNLGEVILHEGRNIKATDVRDADLLALRSTTRVNSALLEGSLVRFVGTATIGTDHMDIPWLDQHNIRWCSAPGCNANSVAEYVTAALLHIAVRDGISLEGRTLGIVGVGNVGKRVTSKALALGMKVMLNDPPREEQGSKPETGGRWHSLDEILAAADIVTLHVPLTREGRYATLQMADSAFFKKMRPGSIFLNTCRGPVMNSAALLDAKAAGRISRMVIDTWEKEPDISRNVLDRADIGTPHIAGYSFEGKVAGTCMVYRSACEFLGKKPTWDHEPLMPKPTVPRISVNAGSRKDEEVLHEIVKQIYDITADDARLRKMTAGEKMAAHFDHLRSSYPVRREFRYTTVDAVSASPSLKKKLADLEFKLT